RVQLEGVMRPLEIVDATEAVKSAALFTKVGRGRHLELQGAVKALEPSVLLWLGGSDDLDGNTELEQPHRQAGEASRPGRSKGRSTVGADGGGQAELMEGGIEDALDLVAVG